ncbi:hypothetical protein [Paenibacillus sp. sgz500958]|uniref:hypothetical protein n=1 Tax=Paenibacillus sp. sgz500958 TaxID=3242475 RepID=UPI0036D42965
MTIKQLINPQNIMIILCIFVIVLLGEKSFLIADKIKTVNEAARLYASGDLIAAEELYRKAADNSSIYYKENEISEYLSKLAPITDIRSTLATLVRSTSDQAATKDLTGLIKSYKDLLALKSKYMQSSSPYQSYYRQLSAVSGLSDQMTSYFRQFINDYYAELETSMSNIDTTDDSFKWNLLLIPGDYYGGDETKEQQLKKRFESHDTKKLAALAGAGRFQSLLDSALLMVNGYKGHDYKAPWVLKQSEASSRAILGKDVEGENITAFAEHALAFRNFAANADQASSSVLSYINKSITRLLNSAKKLARAGKYAEAIKRYGELAPLSDTSDEVAEVTLAWNKAEPVRLLPGGEEQGRYTHVISGSNRYGYQIYAAGIDSSGRLVYAAIKDDGTTVTINGDSVAGAENLSRIDFDSSLGNSLGVPAILTETDLEDGRTSFAAYTVKPEGISVLFSFSGDSYELQDDGSIIVHNADLGDGVDGQTAIYREFDGVYQFTETVLEYPLVTAAELEQHMYENVMIQGDISLDYNGKPFINVDGRYISLWGNVEVGGNSGLPGQFQGGYEYILTDEGEFYVPVFVVDSSGA